MSRNFVFAVLTKRVSITDDPVHVKSRFASLYALPLIDRNRLSAAKSSFISLSRRNDGAREIRSQWDCRQLSNQRELSNSDITQTEDITCWRDAKVLNFDAPMRFLTQRDFQVGIWVRNGMHVGTQLPFGGFCRCFSRRLVASQSARVPAANASVTKTRRTVAAAVMASGVHAMDKNQSRFCVPTLSLKAR